MPILPAPEHASSSMERLVRARGERAGTGYYDLGDGFLYHINRVYEPWDGSATRLYLRCHRYGTATHCAGSARAIRHADGREVLEEPASNHTCRPDHLQRQERELRHQILDVVRNEAYDQPHNIMTRERARYALQDKVSVNVRIYFQ